MEQELIQGPIDGYKIVDNELKCRGFQYKIGKRVRVQNDLPLELCVNGLHFCKYPSGVWEYYREGRVFKVKAYGVLKTKPETGADYKMVCKEIELVSEINVDGDWNTGRWNTGDKNTGDRNTGDRNTGNRNTGYWNTGDRNAGDRNTGCWNTGDRNTSCWNTGCWNTGDQNTGNGNTGCWNAGDRNTGNQNTGDRNTGNRNTGHGNTGHGNATDFSSGFFCTKEQPIVFFDKTTNIKRDEIDFLMVNRLCEKLSQDDKFDVAEFLSLPNATKKNIKALHKAHIRRRNKTNKTSNFYHRTYL